MANPLKRKRGPLSIPTASPLPHTLRIPSSSPYVSKILSKLSRPSLLSLASTWCKEENLKTCGPYISTNDDDPEAPYTAAKSLDEVQELYEDSLARRKGTKREVLDHILEGDWRHGVSLLQLAMAETRYVLEHPGAMRWVAMRLALLHGDSNAHLPPFQPQTFVLALQRELGPLAKAHYYIDRPASHPITIVRLGLVDTPYNTQRAFTTREKPSEAPKSVFIAFPASTPFIYISTSPASGKNRVDAADASVLQQFVVDAIPRAFSRPGERWELKSTGLAARSLDALLSMRGNGRGNAAQGGWSVYADEEGVEGKPMEFKGEDELGEEKENPRPGVKRPFEHGNPTQHLEEREKKRLKKVAEGRFGSSADKDDGKGLHRFDVRIEDAFPASTAAGMDPDDSNATVEGSGDSAISKPWKPSVKLSFQGTHVFAGIRVLVESGIIDGTKVPGWMTGEASVSNGVVKNGRLDSRKAGI